MDKYNIYNNTFISKILGQQVYADVLPTDFDEIAKNLATKRGISFDDRTFMLVADAFVLGNMLER